MFQHTKLSIETVTADQLQDLTETEFNTLRNMAIERQDPDLATLVIWSALCRKLGGRAEMRAKIVWSTDSSASGYCEPLKEGICSWIGDQNYASTSPGGSSSSGDPVAERQGLVAELFQKKWPILIVEQTKDYIGFTTSIEMRSGMCLKTDSHQIFPSIPMISEVVKIISSYPTIDPLIALSFTASLSRIEEMVDLLNKNNRPLILPNYHDEDDHFTSSLGETFHDLDHFFYQNRPNFTLQDLEISRNWINLIYNSVTAIDPANETSMLNDYAFEIYLDLENEGDFTQNGSLFKFVNQKIPLTEAQEPSTNPQTTAAFRIITNLYLQTRNNAQKMKDKFGLELDTRVSLWSSWSSPTLPPVTTTLHALLLRQDNPFRKEVAHFLEQ